MKQNNDLLLTIAMVCMCISGITLVLFIGVPMVDVLLGNAYEPLTECAEVFTVCYFIASLLTILKSVETYCDERSSNNK